MAAPVTADRFVKALRDEGLTVVEHRDWRTHNRNHKGPWGPVHGVMIHHTVTSGTDSSVELCYNGHSDLPGPLCHGVIDKNGVVHLVGNGRTNHAGMGDGDVLNAVINETALPADNEANTDGNRSFYGFECINLGDGKDPWPEVQLTAIEKAAAAVCRAYGWSYRSVIGHKEWQPGKVDPRGFEMTTMRTRINARLTNTTPPPQEDEMTLTTDQADQLAWLRKYSGWPYKGASDRDAFNYLVTTDQNTAKVLANVSTLTSKVDALESVDLSDEQVSAIADKLAASPVLAERIAEQVAAKVAARLAD